MVRAHHDAKEPENYDPRPCVLPAWPVAYALADTGPPDAVWISIVGMALIVLGGVAIQGSRRRSTS